MVKIKTNKGISVGVVVLIIAIIIIVGGLILYYRNNSNSSSTNVSITPPDNTTNNNDTSTVSNNTTDNSGTSQGKTQNGVYESNFMKVTLPTGWTANEVSNNPSALNITNGNYILYINTDASQASGAEGGRFAEISMGAPSVDAVMKSQPADPCGTSVSNAATPGHPRIDLYVSPTTKDTNCNLPTNNKTVWYFSYIGKTINGNTSYFNYYKDGQNPAYVITMAYNSKDINSFPVKGSTELNLMLKQMTDMVKSLEIKNH